jgi:hypothetical protein
LTFEDYNYAMVNPYVLIRREADDKQQIKKEPLNESHLRMLDDSDNHEYRHDGLLDDQAGTLSSKAES